MGEGNEELKMGETRRFRATFFFFLSFPFVSFFFFPFSPDYVFHAEFDRTGRANNTGGLSVSAPLGREESGKEWSGGQGGRKEKREERRQRGGRSSSFDVEPFKAGRAPSTSQNICYGHEERKVTGYTQGVLNTSCLLGIVTFLAKRQQRRECWCYIARPPPFALLAITEANDDGGPQFALELEVVEAAVVVVEARSKVTVVVVVDQLGSFHHQIRLPSITFFRSSYR